MYVTGDDNTINNNLVAANAALGIGVIGNRNRIEGNHSNSNASAGIWIGGGSGNTVFRNSASGNPLGNYSIAAGNDVGPIGTAATSTSPWANIEN